MDFKVRKITKKQIKTKNKLARKCIRFFGHKGLGAIFIALVFLAIVFGAKAFVTSDFFKKQTRNLLNSTLLVDENGHTNILLLGVGGKMAEGGNLSDSVMVLSLNPKGPTASVLSLPRDLFVASSVGDRKLNEVYAAARHKHGDEKGLEIAKEAVSNFAQVEIHYAAVIDFQVFEDAIDWLGGFEIYVPETINDPFYPDVNYGYQTFIVRKGLQRFDGETALKYVRSRKTSSDYSRAKRQQDVIFALRKELDSEGKLTTLLRDATGMKDLYDSYRKRVNTDVGFKEALALVKMGVGVNTNNIETAVLNDDPSQKGGFLYTPAKEFFGGQFVLLPEDLDDTQLFMKLVLISPDILGEDAQIGVYNGSQVEGRARKNAVRLRRLGLHVIETSNYESENGKPVSRAFLRVHSPDKVSKTIEVLKQMYDTVEVLEVPVEERDELIDIELILGFN